MEAIKGSGSARFALYENDVLVNEWAAFGNQTEMSVEPSADTVEVTSTDDEDYGVVTDSETEPGSIKVTAGVNRFSAETLALIFAGVATLDATVAGSISTAEEITVSLGKASRLGAAGTLRTGITNVVVKDNATGATTYTETDDYTVDAVYGFITPTTDGLITEGEVLDVTYDYAAKNEYVIPVNTASSRHIAFFWKGINRFTSKAMSIDIPKTTVKATKQIDVMGKDPANVTFEFTPIKVTGYSSSVIVRKAA